MKKQIVILISVLIIIAAALVVYYFTSQGSKPILVNLQVTENDNSSALAKIINIMASNGIRPATVFVSKEVVEQNCTLVRSLYDKGYEIAAFAYNLSPNGTYVQLGSMPEAEQYQIINSTKVAIYDCIGRNVSGFRDQRFSQNNYTTAILRELHFKWDGNFVTNVNPDAFTKPYYSNGYGFYVVSMQGVPDNNKTYALCDQAMYSSHKSAQEWRQTVENYFLSDRASGNPLLTEFHPSLLVSNQTWFSNFTELISWIKSQNPEYVTTTQLILNCTGGNSTLICGE